MLPAARLRADDELDMSATYETPVVSGALGGFKLVAGRPPAVSGSVGEAPA